MYNKNKHCRYCRWNKRYDENNDTNKIKKYKFCPICGNNIETFNCSPNI